MNTLKTHVFRRQPPRVTLGGYKPPKHHVAPQRMLTKDSQSELVTDEIKQLNSTTVDLIFTAEIPEDLGKNKRRFIHKKEIQAISKDWNMINTVSKRKVYDFMKTTKVRPTTVVSTIKRPSSSLQTSPRRPQVSRFSSHTPRTPYQTMISTTRQASPTHTTPRQTMTSTTQQGWLIKTARTKSQIITNKTPVSPPKLVNQRKSVKNRLTWCPQRNLLFEGSLVQSNDKLVLQEFSKESEENLVDENLKVSEYKGEYMSGERNGPGKVVYTNGDTFSGNYRKNKRVGFGKYRNQAFQWSYKGPWKDNFKHGRGKVTFSDGETIEADWECDQMIQTHNGKINFIESQTYTGQIDEWYRHGRGEMRYSYTALYNGPWWKDMREGHGLLKFKAPWILDSKYGSFFEGHFNNDSTNSYGILVLSNIMTAKWLESTECDDFVLRLDGVEQQYAHFASKYRLRSHDIVWQSKTVQQVEGKLPVKWKDELEDGNWKQGKLNGVGIAKFGSFGFYIGMFKDGCRSGIGKMMYSDPAGQCNAMSEREAVYVGEWKNDFRHGYGCTTWKNGFKYTGHYRKDQRHNVQGKMDFGDGRVYSGNWCEDLLHGVGKFKYTDGNIFKGKFKMGIRCDNGIIEYRNGLVYEGQLQINQPHGKGKLLQKDGSEYSGDFVQEQRDGHGKQTYPNGDYYIGWWDTDHRDGQGIMYYATTGEMYEGEWNCGKRHGYGTLMDQNKATIYSGNWIDGKQEGDGRVVAGRETRYETFHIN